jgi:hypothetical protein
MPEIIYKTDLDNDFCKRSIEQPNWIPDPALSKKKKIPQELNKLICQERRSHLMCHSDAEGYYVPIDFELVIFDKDVGGWLGSSIWLKQELEELAEKMRFELGEYMPNLQKLHKMRKEELDKDAFGYQKWVLLCLYNIATARCPLW